MHDSSSASPHPPDSPSNFPQSEVLLKQEKSPATKEIPFEGSEAYLETLNGLPHEYEDVPGRQLVRVRQEVHENRNHVSRHVTELHAHRVQSSYKQLSVPKKKTHSQQVSARPKGLMMGAGA